MHKNSFQLLSGHKYVSLTTYRKNGQPVATPVWFAQVQDKIIVWTQVDSWKVKRIRNNAEVTLAPCTNSGQLIGEDTADAIARVMSPEEGAAAHKAMRRKYGLTMRFFEMMGRLRGNKHLHLEITTR